MSESLPVPPSRCSPAAPARPRSLASGTGHDDHAAGGGCGNQDGRSGQHPPLPHHRLPRTPACGGVTAALLHRGVENAHTTRRCRGWDSIRVDERPISGWGRGSPARRCRGCTGRTRGAPSSARASPCVPVNPGGSRSLHALMACFERRGARVHRRAVRYPVDGQLARRVRVRERADTVVAHALGELHRLLTGVRRCCCRRCCRVPAGSGRGGACRRCCRCHSPHRQSDHGDHGKGGQRPQCSPHGFSPVADRVGTALCACA